VRVIDEICPIYYDGLVGYDGILDRGDRMKRCGKCGTELPDTMRFCTNCGNPLQEASAVLPVQDRKNKATAKVSAVKIDEVNRTFQIKGTVPKNGKKSGIVGKSMKGLLAVSTVGMSIAAEKALGIGGNSVGKNKWFRFDQLIGYDLLEDDSTVTSGGVGQALIGGVAGVGIAAATGGIGTIAGGLGAVAGGITGKRSTKKKIENLTIRVTLNDFELPCIMIPLITSAVKVGSKEYMNAMEEAYQILSVLDVISHNK